ncbi:MAG: dTDP-4-dehydrorhamnose reductase [Desulfopila sp.]
MKVLLFGKNGQAGWELQRSLAPLGEVIALDRHGEEGLCGDLSDLDGLRATVRQVRPDCIVNAAAYTAVDRAEVEGKKADLVNCEAPGLMATEAAALGCWLVHYSTDYVFNGTGTAPWRETDAVCPLGQYGKSKARGEQAIIESGCEYLIFRTSWVYGGRGENFIRTMLNLMTKRDELKVVGDQMGVPTGAELLADVTAHALRRCVAGPKLKGVYHLAPGGETSWHDYAVFVAGQARGNGVSLQVEDIRSIPTSEYPTPAGRPLNSRLDTGKLRHAFDVFLPHWQDGVARVINEIANEYI